MEDNKEIIDFDKFLKEKFTSKLRPGYTTVDGFLLTEHYLKVRDKIDNFEVFDDDIWLCGFPKTGTTWMAEMVTLIASNLDYEYAKKPLIDRLSFLDFSFIYSPEGYTDPAAIPNFISHPFTHAKNQSKPRIIKSHLSVPLLPKQIRNGERKPRIVYITRNPLDVCISYYHMSASTMFTGTEEQFYQLFLAGKVLWGPFFKQVLPFWQRRNEPNILILKYEDMKRNLGQEIRRVSSFLGKTISDEQVVALEKYLSFEVMKARDGKTSDKIIYSFHQGPKKSSFIRAGVVGSYKKEMPKSYVDTFKTWMEKNLKGTGLHYDY